MSDPASTNPHLTVQQPLAPTGQHDAHLYDPNAGGDHNLLAVFEDVAAAEAARRQVLALGVPDGAVRVADRTGEARSGGFWDGLKRLLIPDEDAHGYAESIQRGHAVLVVQPEGGRRLDVIRALEASNPIDFDARLEEWRAAGWDALDGARGQAETRTLTAADPAAAVATTTATGRSATVVQATPAGGAPVPPLPDNYVGGFTGGTFTGTDAAGSPGASGAAQRAQGAEYARVRGYTSR